MKSQTLLKTLQSNKSTSRLPARDERLLMRYMDSEGGAITRWRAQRLMAKSQLARDFFEQISALSDATHRVMRTERQAVQVDLWERISIRLEQEERAQQILGTRSPASTSIRRRARFSFEPALWVGSGALATTCIMLVLGEPGVFSGRTLVSQPSSVKQASVKQASVKQASVKQALVQQTFNQTSQSSNRNSARRIASFDSRGSSLFADARMQGKVASASESINQNKSRITVTNSEAPRALEVDWMHSNGSIRMLNDRNQAGAIIWIKPRTRSVSNRRELPERSFREGAFTPEVLAQGQFNERPLYSVVPNLMQLESDRSNQIVVLNSDVPQAKLASDQR